MSKGIGGIHTRSSQDQKEIEERKQKDFYNDKEFESKVKELWKEINTDHDYVVIDSYDQFFALCLDVANFVADKN